MSRGKRRIDSPNQDQIAVSNETTEKKMKGKEVVEEEEGDSVHPVEEEEEEQVEEEEEEAEEESAEDCNTDEEQRYKNRRRRRRTQTRERKFFKEELKETDELPNFTGLMSRIPEEIFMDILSRLPIKTLYNLRLVSKAWFFIVRHPRFAKLHLARSIHSKNSQSVIFIDKLNQSNYLVDHQVFESLGTSARARFYVAQIRGDRRMVEEINSCNGLVFSHDRGLIEEIDSQNGLVFSHKPHFYISNPITGEYIMLPESPMLGRPATVSGFGLDSVTNEYKIIRMLDKNEMFSNKDVQIYTLGSGGWRSIPNVPYMFLEMQSSVFLNGNIHWIGYEDGKSMDSLVIITFKVSIEEFGHVPLPPGLNLPHGNTFPQYLLVLGECLCFVHRPSHEHTEIWVMKEYGVPHSWVKEYVINNINMGYHSGGPYEPIQLMNNGEMLSLISYRNLGYYDPKTEILTPIEVHGINSQGCVFRPLVHVASLISPRSMVE